MLGTNVLNICAFIDDGVLIGVSTGYII